jgi:hypothetical protein
MSDPVPLNEAAMLEKRLRELREHAMTLERQIRVVALRDRLAAQLEHMENSLDGLLIKQMGPREKMIELGNMCDIIGRRVAKRNEQIANESLDPVVLSANLKDVEQEWSERYAKLQSIAEIPFDLKIV